MLLYRRLHPDAIEPPAPLPLAEEADARPAIAHGPGGTDSGSRSDSREV
ncbi:MAG TPA: hypothetical protein VIL41_08610 [Coriobacteriia bacterium]